jgi:hypothetical protein
VVGILDHNALLAPVAERPLDFGLLEHVPGAPDDLLDRERVVGGVQHAPHDVRRINPDGAQGGLSDGAGT